MKKQALVAFMMLSLMFTLEVTLVTAQSGSHFMRVTIPFEFAVRGKTLPPTITQSLQIVRKMLLIQNLDGGVSEYVLTNNVQSKTPQGVSKIIFNRYGDRYFLSQIWTAGDFAGREVPKSGRERTVEIANNATDRQMVTLLASPK